MATHRFELWGTPIESDIEEAKVLENHVSRISQVRLELAQRRIVCGWIEIKNGKVIGHPTIHYDPNLAVIVPLHPGPAPKRRRAP